MSDARQSKYKKLIKHLESLKGSGTELVSLYIPPKYAVTEVATQLSNEASQAANIKSKQTRKNVQGALQRITQYLKNVDYQVPANGLAIFAGSLEREAGSDKIELFTVEPPQEVKSKIYQCDNKFFLDPLKDQLASDEIYGLIVVDKRECTVAVMQGKRYDVKFHSKSMVPGKTRAGGQSARRFAQLRSIAAHEFFKKCSEAINDIFVPHAKELKGLIFGGPGSTKDDFLKEDLLNHQIKDKVLGTLSTGYTDEYGIKELLNSSDELLKDAEITKERQLLDEFMKQVVTNGLVTYGSKQVLDALKNGQVEKLLLSEEFDKKQEGNKKKLQSLVCVKCSQPDLKFLDDDEAKQELARPCPSCGANDSLEFHPDPSEHVIDLAQHSGVPTEIVSTDTQEGKTFLDAFGGIGAFLRYKV